MQNIFSNDEIINQNIQDMKKLVLVFVVLMFVTGMGMILTSCTKEGPQGPAGADASSTCKECHAANVVDKVATEFELSKHSWGTTAFEEAGNTGCTPCHTQKAFVYMCKNNVSSAFTFNDTIHFGSAAKNKWTNNYQAAITDVIGEINCFTCHSSLHTTYGFSDLTSLTTIAPVSMTMWGGAKTIDLAQDSSRSNLCVKCHQPRPLVCNAPSTAKSNARLFPYDTLKNLPNLVMFDSAAPSHNIWIKPSYRMHVHYGAVGAVYAGQGGIEYAGSLAYANSPHTTHASCEDCHMAEPMYGIAGGHAFNERNSKETPLSTTTTWNFNGCNVTGCHADSPLSSTAPLFKNTRSTVKGLLDQLATKINAAGGGHDILHSDATASNLWAGVATGNYDGYLDIYTPGTNDGGYWKDPYLNGNSTNDAKPMFPSLKMVQVGAIVNFQLCLREYSLGIHNTQYVTALLTNTLDAMTAAGL
jgi:hypothetical protein